METDETKLVVSNGANQDEQDSDDTTSTVEPATTERKRKRTERPYPTISFEEALELAQHIQEFAAGKKVRRLTLLDHIGKTETSSATRQWITDSKKYGLIEGSYNSEYLELTEEGYKASADELPLSDRVQARVQLAILNVFAFRVLYEEYAGDKLPLQQVLSDKLRGHNIDEQLINPLVNIFLVNLKFTGMLKTVAGAERILTVEHLLEELPDTSALVTVPSVTIPKSQNITEIVVTRADQHFEQACFYITPIGEIGSETRQHSDLFLEYLVKPALTPFGLNVVRADQIDKPGMITRQIIDYLLRARLVIADLSFHNPNVFYELALRHVMRLPTVQIIKTSDSIPFDVNQNRTISIDCTSIYTLVPKLDTYRAEIQNQVRRALEDPDSVDNPVTAFYPTFKISLE